MKNKFSKKKQLLNLKCMLTNMKYQRKMLKAEIFFSSTFSTNSPYKVLQNFTEFHFYLNI